MHSKTIFYGLLSALLIIAVVWGRIVVWGYGVEIRVQEDALDHLEENFIKLATAEETYDEIKNRYKDQLSQFDSLKQGIPNRDTFVSVLEEIRTIAEKQHLEIVSLSPVLEDSFPAIKYKLSFTGKHVERYPVQLQVLGDYLNIGAFLSEISSQKAIINFSRIHIASELEADSKLSCKVTLFTYMFLENVRNTG